jgi:hypothetical protein
MRRARSVGRVLNIGDTGVAYADKTAPESHRQGGKSRDETATRNGIRARMLTDKWGRELFVAKRAR